MAIFVHGTEKRKNKPGGRRQEAASLPRKAGHLRAKWRMGKIKIERYQDVAWFLLVMIIPHILVLILTCYGRYIGSQFEFSVQGWYKNVNSKYPLWEIKF